MAYVDIDFAVPIALLAASIVGVVLVRTAAARGERAAKMRAQRLIEQHAAGLDEADGMRDTNGASSE